MGTILAGRGAQPTPSGALLSRRLHGLGDFPLSVLPLRAGGVVLTRDPRVRLAVILARNFKIITGTRPIY